MNDSVRARSSFEHLVLGGVAALAFALYASAAPAKDLPDKGLSIEQVASWLQNEGYKAEMQKSSDGTPNIASSSDGQTFHIYMYDCKDDVCASLQFSEGFDTKGTFTADKINDWNKNNRWARAYIDKENDPWVEYDVDLAPGGTYEGLKDQFGIWQDALSHFRKFIGW